MKGLKKKAGPLPVWAWALLAGGGLGAYLLYRRSQANATSSTAAPPGANSGTVTPDPAGLSQGGLTPGASGDTTTAPPPAQPDLAQEISDVTGLLGSLENLQQAAQGVAAGTFTPAAAAPSDGATPPGGQASAGASTVAQTAHPAAAKSLVKTNTLARNPRQGLNYVVAKVDGKTVHRYGQPVPGGIGPGRNLIVVGATSTKGTSHRAPASHHKATRAKPKAKTHKQPTAHQAPHPQPVHTGGAGLTPQQIAWINAGTHHPQPTHTKQKAKRKRR